MYLHYFPQESNPKISEEEKAELLKEWWEKDFGLMASVGYTPNCFVSMTQGSRILFRNGVKELITFS
jgi:hypothetical protein